MSQVAEYNEADNPYRAPAGRRSRGTTEVSLDGHLAGLQAFVGSNVGYYFRKWGGRLQDPEKEIGMNWAAFFLTAMWICYRKMYRVAFIFYAVIVLLWIGLAVLFMGVLGLESIPAGVNLIVNVVTAIICGLYGNVWYLDHAERAVADLRAQGADDEYLLHALARRGGASWLSAFGMPFLLSIIAVIGLTILFILTGVR